MDLFSADYLLIAKSLHIIFVVAWFAALFYLPRLFIYQVEAQVHSQPARVVLIAQLRVMQKRLLYIISWPAAVLTTVFAVWMLIINPAYLTMPWLQLKLVFVALLFLYQIYCQVIFNKLGRGVLYRSTNLRFFNELATLLLFAIVFTAVLKNTSGWAYGVVGLLGLGVVLSVAIMLYRKARKKRGEKVD